MTKINKETKAYFAGFFDGEGYVGIYSNSKTSEAIRVIIGQSTADILFQLKDIWGGSVYPRHDKRTGRKHYAWEIRSRKAEKFLVDISPYVIIKKAQLRLSLEAVNEDYERKLEIKDLIKGLNSPMGFGISKLTGKRG